VLLTFVDIGRILGVWAEAQRGEGLVQKAIGSKISAFKEIIKFLLL